MSLAFSYRYLREIVKARRFLRSYGFSVELCCGCDEDNPKGDCLNCQMEEIKSARRKAMEKELAAKEKQRYIASCEGYLLTHGYKITRPDGKEIPLTIEMLEHRVRCNTIPDKDAWAQLVEWGKTMKQADKLIELWSWPRTPFKKNP